MLSSSLEEYLKTIYILKNTNGAVRVTDISKKLGCSKPSVNRAINCLKDEGLILYETYGDIEITEEGIKTAKSVLKRYDILKLFLTEIVDVDEVTAEKEAAAMKHSVSEETISKVESFIIKMMGLDELNCNFDLANNSCRQCIKVKTKLK